jgi:predicted enzyme related to lactoylglutathione lyase
MLQNAPLYSYFPATDVARARAFYEGTLGLKPGKELAGGVVYQFGENTAAFLYPTPNGGTSKASQAFWQVHDLEREVAALQARGVSFEEFGGIVTGGGAQAAWFRDSEGNILALIQPL